MDWGDWINHRGGLRITLKEAQLGGEEHRRREESGRELERSLSFGLK